VTKSQILRESREEGVVYALVVLGESPSALVRQIIMPADLLDKFPPLRDIQHAIDFVPVSVCQIFHITE